MNSANPQPRPDPLIDEIREIRRQLSEAHGNDVRQLCDYLRELQDRQPPHMIRRLPRRPSASQPH